MNDQIRLSDAERETASQALGEHYAQGRLDADEHAERHERIWSARTRGEIPPVFADLPGGSPLHPVVTTTPPWPGAPRRAPFVAPPRPSGRRRGLPLPLKVLLVIGLVLLVAKGWPFILVGLGVFWLVSHRSHGRCAPTSKRYSTG
ncbi:MAG: DUF1707 domain-containing protein [Aeromicrobium sp.]